MPTLPKPKPRFYKYVAKPANVGAAEISRAQPVYIDGLPGDAVAIADVEGLQAIIDDYEDRIAALEAI